VVGDALANLLAKVGFDVTKEFTLTGGGRWYKFDNTVFGFAGLGRNPDFFQGAAGNINGNGKPSRIKRRGQAFGRANHASRRGARANTHQ
jgi:hypothetical protein